MSSLPDGKGKALIFTDVPFHEYTMEMAVKFLADLITTYNK